MFAAQAERHEAWIDELFAGIPVRDAKRIMAAFELVAASQEGAGR